MAKFVVNVDTDEGTLEVSMNGKKLEDVCCVDFDKGQTFDYEKNMIVDKVYVSISSAKKDDSGAMIQTRICASLAEQMKDAIKGI